MRRQPGILLLISLLAGMTGIDPSRARAAWVADGEALSPNASNYRPFIIPDGGTGSIIAWHGGASSDIFARRVLADGSTAPGWPAATPLTVCAATGLQEFPVAVPDGAGGAFLFWQDARNGTDYDVYGQHLGASGQVVSGGSSNWVGDGIPIATASGNQYSPVAVSDGAGGAILVWQDGRHGAGNYDIYAQRVDGDGNLLWAPAGVPVCVAANNQVNPAVVADGAGGVYVAWQDYRKGTEYDIYVQHLTASGAVYADPRWVTDGVGICTAANSQFYPVLAGDGAGGAYVAWQDFRSGTDNHIYAQRVGATGAISPGWPADGAPVCQAQFSQYYPVVANDGANGVFVAWQDYRSGTTNHVYAQHLMSAAPVWVADGVALSTAPNGQFSPQIAGDGRGGAFVTWYDARSGATNDIYVQQVSGRGTLNPLWDPNGLAVCVAPNTQQFPVLTTSATGTATMTWQDLRSGSVTTAAIYAQQAVGASLAAVGPSAGLVAHVSAARPNPARGPAALELTLPAPAFVRADVLDVGGRRVATIAAGTFAAGVHELSWDGTAARGGRAAPGVYLVRVEWPGFEHTQRVVRLP